MLRAMSGKDAGLRIRIDKQLRDEFQAACAAENRAASDVLREFMRSFADRRVGGKQASLFTTTDSGTAGAGSGKKKDK